MESSSRILLRLCVTFCIKTGQKLEPDISGLIAFADSYLVESVLPNSFIKLCIHLFALRILAFSNASITTVTVKLNGKHHGEAIHIEGPLFVIQWNPLMFANGLHSIAVHVVVGPCS